MTNDRCFRNIDLMLGSFRSKYNMRLHDCQWSRTNSERVSTARSRLSTTPSWRWCWKDDDQEHQERILSNTNSDFVLESTYTIRVHCHTQTSQFYVEIADELNKWILGADHPKDPCLAHPPISGQRATDSRPKRPTVDRRIVVVIAIVVVVVIVIVIVIVMKMKMIVMRWSRWSK